MKRDQDVIKKTQPALYTKKITLLAIVTLALPNLPSRRDDETALIQDAVCWLSLREKERKGHGRASGTSVRKK